MAFLGESGLMHQLIRPESELGDKVEIQRLWFSFLQKSLRAKLLAASGQNLLETGDLNNGVKVRTPGNDGCADRALWPENLLCQNVWNIFSGSRCSYFQVAANEVFLDEKTVC